MFNSSAYSKPASRPSTAKVVKQPAPAAAAASAWTGSGSFDRNMLARTVAIAQSVSRGSMPEGCHLHRSLASSNTPSHAQLFTGQDQLTALHDHLVGVAGAAGKGSTRLRDKLQERINVADMLAGRCNNVSVPLVMALNHAFLAGVTLVHLSSMR